MTQVRNDIPTPNAIATINEKLIEKQVNALIKDIVRGINDKIWNPKVDVYRHEVTGYNDAVISQVKTQFKDKEWKVNYAQQQKVDYLQFRG
jgi:hypothetical protein